MERVRLNFTFALIMALSLVGVFTPPAYGQEVKTTFFDLGTPRIPVPSVLYEPAAPGDKSQIAILMMHPDRDYMTHTVCAEMSKRGYRVLCEDSSILKVQSDDLAMMDGLLADLGLGVRFLRKYPGVRKVVLFGHSGGGALMSAYQNIAENGAQSCQGPEKIFKCSNRLAGLPPADGLLLIDSNWGMAAMTLFAIDPAVASEDDGQKLNPKLDMYNPANGFIPSGSTYSPEFMHRFFRAEGQRNNKLIQTALDRLKAIDSGKGLYSDDEPFVVPGAGLAAVNNKLYAQDIRLMSHTRKPWPLLHADGTISTEVVRSLRGPENRESLTHLFEDGAMRTTVRNFLSMSAVRVTDDYGYDEDSVHGVDWSSSYTNPPGNVKGISVPTLVMGMTGHWEFLASETIYENSKSTDKQLIFVEGASHMYATCKECEKYPGQFGDTLKTTYDYVDKWLGQKGRYLDNANVAVSEHPTEHSCVRHK